MPEPGSHCASPPLGPWQLAFQIAFACLLTRICGDIMQNALDGCWWKVALFVGFEPIPILGLYLTGSI